MRRSRLLTRMVEALSGDRLNARVGRSTSWIILGYGASQALRLASNLLLTRLLFPEAFGLMALISTVTVGLTLFSDVGISPSIAQSKRGDDPNFLNTAWSIQVIRGALLWIIATILAGPIAAFYEQPELSFYLPIAALTLIIAGFNPTRIETAHRHLLMGRLTLLDLAAQAIGILSMAVLAVLMQSVMALVLGGIIGAGAKLVLMHAFLPGQANRFEWDNSASSELIGFGKWIFLSTACWFFASQGDKLILGKFLTMEGLGIYNIGYFLASFPVLLAAAVAQRVMIPIYREDPAADRVRRLRYLMSGGPVILLIFMAFAGPWLVALLYDDRYLEAGSIVVLLALAQMPQVIGTTYDQAALAAGESRRFFFYSATRSLLQFTFLLFGAIQGGIAGAIAGLAIALLLSHVVLIWLAKVQGVWDARHDAVFAGIILLAAVVAISIHGETIHRQLGPF